MYRTQYFTTPKPKKVLTNLTGLRTLDIVKAQMKGRHMASTVKYKNNLKLIDDVATLDVVIALLKRHQVVLWSTLATAEFAYIIVKSVF